MPRRHTSYQLKTESDGLLSAEFDNVYNEKQEVSHKTFPSGAPNVRDLGNGEFILALVSGTLRIYTKFRNELYFVDLTKA